MDVAVAVSLQGRAAARHVRAQVELHRRLADVGGVQTLHGNDGTVLIDDVNLRHPVDVAIFRRDHRMDRRAALHADEDPALGAIQGDVRSVLLAVDFRKHRVAVGIVVRGLLPQEVGVDGLPRTGCPLLRAAGCVGRSCFRKDLRRRRDRDGLTDP